MRPSWSPFRRRTVSTVRKSQARLVAACARRNERQSSRSLRCRRDTSRLQNVVHQCRRHVDPEFAQFPDDPDVAPVRVLARKPQNQLARRAVDRGPAWTLTRIGPVARDESPVPAQKRLRPHDQGMPVSGAAPPDRGCEQQPVAHRELRPAHLPPQGHQLMPQHTRISSSFDRSRPVNSTTNSSRRHARTYRNDTARALPEDRARHANRDLRTRRLNLPSRAAEFMHPAARDPDTGSDAAGVGPQSSVTCKTSGCCGVAPLTGSRRANYKRARPSGPRLSAQAASSVPVARSRCPAM